MHTTCKQSYRDEISYGTSHPLHLMFVYIPSPTTLPRHTTTPHYHTTPQYHTTTPHYHTTLPHHTTIPHHTATPHYHTTLPHHTTTPHYLTTLLHHTTTYLLFRTDLCLVFIHPVEEIVAALFHEGQTRFAPLIHRKRSHLRDVHTERPMHA